MAGNHRLHRDIFNCVRQWTDNDLADFDDSSSLCRRFMWPQFAIEMARYSNPF
jgi:hypothetical protein